VDSRTISGRSHHPLLSGTKFALIRGTFPIGVTKYLFWPGTTWASRITSTHHFWTIPYVMWATNGFVDLAALWLSMVAVVINVSLSRYLTPMSIHFVDEKMEDATQQKKGDIVYLNINMAHELWTDISFQFLLMGQNTLPYLIRLIIGWFICNTMVFGLLYGLSKLLMSHRSSCDDGLELVVM
jgi:predicted membrane protein